MSDICPQCSMTNKCTPDCSYLYDVEDGRVEHEPKSTDSVDTDESCPNCGGPLTVRARGGRRCSVDKATCDYAASLRQERDSAIADRIDQVRRKRKCNELLNKAIAERDSAREKWRDEQRHTENAQQEAIDARKQRQEWMLRAAKYQALLQRIADMPTDPRPDGSHNYDRSTFIWWCREILDDE